MQKNLVQKNPDEAFLRLGAMAGMQNVCWVLRGLRGTGKPGQDHIGQDLGALRRRVTK